jgi:hypothetical protein
VEKEGCRIQLSQKFLSFNCRIFPNINFKVNVRIFPTLTLKNINLKFPANWMPMDCLVTRASTTTSSTSQWNRAMPNGLVSIGKKRVKTLLLFFEELAKMEPKSLQMTVPEKRQLFGIQLD